MMVCRICVNAAVVDPDGRNAIIGHIYSQSSVGLLQKVAMFNVVKTGSCFTFWHASAKLVHKQANFAN